jgi:hypothetical protein
MHIITKFIISHYSMQIPNTQKQNKLIDEDIIPPQIPEYYIVFVLFISQKVMYYFL